MGSESGKGFAEQYAMARQFQAGELIDRVLNIVSNMEPTPAGIALARRRIDPLKWQYARIRAKKYGEWHGAVERKKVAVILPNALRMTREELDRCIPLEAD